MGVAVLVDPAQIVDVVRDYDHHLILLKVTPGRPSSIMSGGTWSQSSDFPDRTRWEAYVAQQRGSFDPTSER